MGVDWTRRLDDGREVVITRYHLGGWILFVESLSAVYPLWYLSIQCHRIKSTTRAIKMLTLSSSSMGDSGFHYFNRDAMTRGQFPPTISYGGEFTYYTLDWRPSMQLTWRVYLNRYHRFTSDRTTRTTGPSPRPNRLPSQLQYDQRYLQSEDAFDIVRSSRKLVYSFWSLSYGVR